MTRSLPISLAALIAAGVPAGAQIEDLNALKSSRQRIEAVSDSLREIRSRHLARKDSLTSLVDSLRVRDPGSEDHRRARLQSRQLMPGLLYVEARLDRAAAVMDSLDEELRTAYDWEISQLIKLLEDEGWDWGLYNQLEAFQEERRELGEVAGPSHYRLDDEHELALNEQDGPDEVRQKIDLAQYKAARVREGWHTISHRLECIEDQLLLLQRMELAEGGSVGVRIHPGSQRQQVGGAPPPYPVPSPPAEAPLLLQAQRLKARQQELREVLTFLEDRIKAFKAHMRQILDGAE